MSKVTMPEPVVLRTVMPNDYRYGHIYGYTGKQMEAYAAAKVREALEEAARVCDAYFNEITEPRSNPYYDGALDASDILERRIRALIPSTPA